MQVTTKNKSSSVLSSFYQVGSRDNAPAWVQRAAPPKAGCGALPILKSLGKALLDHINNRPMHVYDKKQKDGLCGKKYKNCKFRHVYELLCLDLKQVAYFEYNFLLILFHYAATNCKLDENWKCANVTHFSSFAGMLPVIFGIFNPLFHFLSPSKTEVTCQKDGHDGWF